MPGQPCPNKPDEWELIEGVEKLAEVKWGVSTEADGTHKRKFFAIASNQSGVALGYMSEDCAYGMLMELANLLTRGALSESDWRLVRMCSHAATAGCDCRKPKPGLLHELLGAHPLVHPSRALFVGDQESDQQAAQAAGIDFMWAWDFFGRTREEWAEMAGGLAPLKLVDTRSERWKAAEVRCTASHADPADLAIIAEEQAKWDAANPEASTAPPSTSKCESCGYAFPRNACEQVIRNIPGATRSMVLCLACSIRYPLGTIPPNAPMGPAAEDVEVQAMRATYAFFQYLVNVAVPHDADEAEKVGILAAQALGRASVESLKSPFRERFNALYGLVLGANASKSRTVVSDKHRTLDKAWARLVRSMDPPAESSAHPEMNAAMATLRELGVDVDALLEGSAPQETDPTKCIHCRATLPAHAPNCGVLMFAKEDGIDPATFYERHYGKAPRQPLTMIVAIACGGVIGKARGLPWPRISEDLRHFKRETWGHTLIVGRKTWADLPPFGGRRLVVLSRTPGPRTNRWQTSIEAAIADARRDDPVNEPIVIGGAEVYRAALPYVTRILLTEIDHDYEGDVFFHLDRTGFVETERRAGETPGVSFVTLERA